MCSNQNHYQKLSLIMGVSFGISVIDGPEALEERNPLSKSFPSEYLLGYGILGEISEGIQLKS